MLAQGTGIEASGELGRTLRRLETLAVRPVAELGSEAADELSRLQYSLHLLAERLIAHTELADALVGARDATAEIAETATHSGWETAAPLVYEWRGALFRVRLAQATAEAPRPQAPSHSSAPAPDLRAALTALGLTLGGGAAFVGGAVTAIWPLWAAGMIAVIAGLLVYRP